MKLASHHFTGDVHLSFSWNSETIPLAHTLLNNFSL